MPPRFLAAIDHLVRTLVEQRELTLATSVVLRLQKYTERPSTTTGRELTLMVDNAKATIAHKKECSLCPASGPSSSTSLPPSS